MVNIIASHLHLDGYVSNIEFLWTIVAVIGAGFAAFNIKEAFDDNKAIDLANVGNGRALIARSSLRGEITRFIVQALHVMIGILAMTIKEDPIRSHQNLDLPWNIEAAQFLVPWGLVLVGVLLSLQSYWVFQVRRKLLRVTDDNTS